MFRLNRRADNYGLSEKVRILLTPKQKRILQQEAAARGTTVSALIRNAMDRVFVPVSDDARRRACQGIVERRVQFITPPELDEIAETRFEDFL